MQVVVLLSEAILVNMAEDLRSLNGKFANFLGTSTACLSSIRILNKTKVCFSLGDIKITSCSLSGRRWNGRFTVLDSEE